MKKRKDYEQEIIMLPLTFLAHYIFECVYCIETENSIIPSQTGCSMYSDIPVWANTAF